MATCNNCGATVSDAAKFCTECGTKIDKVETETQYVFVEKAGSLLQILNNPTEVKSLSINGYINASDFNFLKKHCTSIQNIYLSGVEICSYEGSEGTNEGYNYYYNANEIPLGSFFYWLPIDDGMPSLKSVVLPDNIIEIGRNAFARAYNLADINFPEGLNRIGFVSFAFCKTLNTIALPSTLKRIDDCAFNNCECLENVYIKAENPPHLGNNVFDGISKEAFLFVPTESYGKYKSSLWSHYFKEIIPD